MSRLSACAVLASLVLMVSTPPAMAQKKKVEITQKWSGSVDNEKLMKPECITTAKGFEGVWKAFNIAGDVPKVDFGKDMVVAVYSVGSKLNLAAATLDEKGNLTVVGFGTLDIRPGFRYVLGVVSRDGVKTVNKKELPKD